MTRNFAVPRLLLLCVIALLLGAVAGNAQNITGEIDGTVRDSTGAVVVGATVLVTNVDTRQLVRTLKTSKSGEYAASLLQVGNYKIEVKAPGFGEESQIDISLDVSDTLTKNFTLKPGETNVEVTVRADSERPNLETSENASIIGGTEMEELALNTRNFQQILLLQPGVSYGGPDELNVGQVDAQGSKNSHQLSINGLQPAQVVFQLDGADMLNHVNQVQTVVFPSVESIAQTKTIRNSYGAQYGGGGSAQVIVVTKAGGADFHGDAYYFYRGAALNATPILDETSVPPQPKPDTKYADFGFTLGGPLFIPKFYPRAKSKSFFFYSQEIRRITNFFIDLPGRIPTPAFLNGYFDSPVCVKWNNLATEDCAVRATYNPASPYPGNPFQIPKIDPVAAEYAKDMIGPSIALTPGANDPLEANNLAFQVASPLSETQELVRIDHQFNERLSGFFRFLYDPIHQNVPNGLNQNGRGYPGVGASYIDSYGAQYLGHFTWTAKANTVLEFGGSYEPYRTSATPYGSITQAASPDVQVNLPSPNTTGRVPTLIVVGRAWTATGPQSDLAHTLQVFENTTHTIGKHTVYFGGNHELYTERVNAGLLNAGSFNFNSPTKQQKVTLAGVSGSPFLVSQFSQSWADFEFGYPTSFQQASVDAIASPRASLYEAYVQDNWRATATLTLNLGLRYSVYRQPSDDLGHLGGFQPQAYNAAAAPAINPAAPGGTSSPNDGTICSSTTPCYNGALPNANYKPLNGIAVAGQNSAYGNALSRTPLLGFQPRLGFAWNLYGNGNTALRGGYGIYYNQSPLSTFDTEVDGNPAYVQTQTYNLPGSFVSPGGGCPACQVNPINGINREWVMPYTQSYSLDVQQQVGKNAVIDLAYVGNKTIHLQGQEDLNQPLPGQYITANVSGGVLINPNNTNQLNSIRPYLGYSAIEFVSTRFFAAYNGLQASLNQRFGKRSIVGLAYTWSKALSNSPGPPLAGGPDEPQNRYDLSGEYGPTVLDRRDIFIAHFVYELPSHSSLHGFVGGVLNGWEFSGIVNLTTGTPLTPTQLNSDPAGQGGLAAGSNATPRPDVVSNPNHNVRSLTAFLLASDYALVPAGQYRPGNEKVGSVHGPGYQNVTMDLFKNFELPETLRLQLRFEAFNALNHVNYKTVDTALGAATFGAVTQTFENRIVQLGAKLLF